jgi:hypothetical protein
VIARSPDGFWRSSLLAGQDWLDHQFGTATAAPEGGFLTLNQIHSSRVVDALRGSDGQEGDALVACEPGVRIAVKTADCVPILLADPVVRLVAAVHAGWRGTLKDVAGQTVRHLCSRYGSDPANLLAALGPSIGPCCYEVGPDVSLLFQDLSPARKDRQGRAFVDLREANAALLRRAGVAAAHIDAAGAPCTFCGGPEFHSWRRDRVAGVRMFSVIAARQAFFDSKGAGLN